MNARSFQYIDDDSGSRMVFTTHSNPIDRYYLQEHVSSHGFSISVTSSKAVGHLECACCWEAHILLSGGFSSTSIPMIKSNHDSDSTSTDHYQFWSYQENVSMGKTGVDLHHGQVLHWIKLLQTKAWNQNLWYHKQIEVYIVVPYVNSTWQSSFEHSRLQLSAKKLETALQLVSAEMFKFCKNGSKWRTTRTLILLWTELSAKIQLEMSLQLGSVKLSKSFKKWSNCWTTCALLLRHTQLSAKNLEICLATCFRRKTDQLQDNMLPGSCCVRWNFLQRSSRLACNRILQIKIAQIPHKLIKCGTTCMLLCRALELQLSYPSASRSQPKQHPHHHDHHHGIRAATLRHWQAFPSTPPLLYTCDFKSQEK